jgi:hypothetical protein
VRKHWGLSIGWKTAVNEIFHTLPIDKAIFSDRRSVEVKAPRMLRSHLRECAKSLQREPFTARRVVADFHDARCLRVRCTYLIGTIRCWYGVPAHIT